MGQMGTATLESTTARLRAAGCVFAEEEAAELRRAATMPPSSRR